VRRKPERARYDRDTLYEILDAALICHVGFVREGHPFVLPTIHARIEDVLYLHGSTASGMLNAIGDGGNVCVTATEIDGIVFARSVFHHSMNYRSAVVLGRARTVDDPDEAMRAMRALVEHVAPGRWDEARQPGARELAATLIVALPIDEASAKIRTGPPVDDEEDLSLPVWAGVVPLQRTFGEPIPDPALDPAIPPSSAATALRAPHA
jgi:hypothetical protein